MSKWWIYGEDGMFTGRSIDCPADSLNQNVPNGHGCIMGPVDIPSQRVNMTTGLIVDYQPPQPSNNHVWNTTSKRWDYVAPLEEEKAQAWDRIKVARGIAEFADFEHDGNVYQADRDRINGAVTAAILAQLSNTTYSINWILSNNTTVTLNGPQMMAVGAALAQKVKTVFERGVVKRAVINAATTKSALDVITWLSEE